MAFLQAQDELLDYKVDEQNTLADGDVLLDEEDGTDTGPLSTTDVTMAERKPKFAGHASVHSTGFQDMMLKPELIRAIAEAGFEHPSEVQHQCIPQAMLGMDILCQAKSGMGKTAVFVITSLQELDPFSPEQPSILVLAPTRELAYQIATEYQRFKKYMPGCRLGLFFGGTTVREDVENLKGQGGKGGQGEHAPLQIVVGTPGRLLALLRCKALDLSHVKVFVVDECDKMLLGEGMRADVQEIFAATPPTKQVIMLSATLPKEIIPACDYFLKNPIKLTVNDDHDLTLEKLQQFYLKTLEADKTRSLMDLLDLLEFNQVIVFTNTVVRCLALGEVLTEQSFPVITIHSGMSQEERLEKYHQFKSFEKRILVATDLFGRGMDIQRVNIVVNYDCPLGTDVYLHRIARAGRFGSKGLSVTFIASDADSRLMNEVQDRFDISIAELPDEIDCTLYMDK